jgi:hypothetical protein
MWALLVLAGCRDSAMSTADDTGGGDASALAEKLGCDSSLSVFGDLVVEPTEVTNVKRLMWNSTEPVRPRVVTDIGRETLIEGSVLDQDSTQGEVLLLGVPYQRPSTSILIADTEAGVACSSPHIGQIHSLDPAIPEITLSHWDPDSASGGFTVAGLITDEASMVVILDEQGEYVWSKEAGLGVVSRAAFARDESSLLYMTWAEHVHESGTIYRLAYDGSLVDEVKLTGAHTDFVELPHGGMAAIGWDLRDIQDAEGRTDRVLGDTIVEIDSQGNERVVWSVFDSYIPDLGLDYDRASIGMDEDLLDWSHGNGLDYDEEEDDYLISLFGLGAVLRIDRETGEVLWTLSDTHGDFENISAEPLIQGAHSVEVLSPDRILIFNRNIPNPLDDMEDIGERCSEAVELALDSSEGQVEKVWSYGSEDCVLVVYFGEAIRLQNDHTLTIFSSSGQISEADPDGETVWQVNLDVGGAFGFGDWRESLY